MVFSGREKIHHLAVVPKKLTPVIVPVDRHCQCIADTQTEKGAASFLKIRMPVLIHADVLESGMLYPGKGFRAAVTQGMFFSMGSFPR